MLRGPRPLLLALVVTLLATAPALAAPQLRDRVVASVDSDPILETDVERALAFAAAPPAAGESDRERRRHALDGLIDERLRIHEVQRYGFEQVPVELITKQIAVIRARFPSEDAFKRRLAALGMQTEGLEQLVAQQLQVMTYVDELLGARVFVGLEEIQAYYDKTLVPELQAKHQPVPPLEDVREQVREVLRQQRLNDELVRWTAELRSRADVEDYFDRPQRPLPPRVGSKP